MNKLLIYSLITISLISFSRCKNEKEPREKKITQSPGSTQQIQVIEVQSPKAGELFTLGDLIDLDISLKDTLQRVDSLLVQTDLTQTTIGVDNLNYTWNTQNHKTGNNKLHISAYAGGKKIDTYTLKLRFKSDRTPELFECKIINTYPHDTRAYTQGLFYDNGIIYEGTGQKGESSLRKVVLETGELIQSLSLPAKYFGEGITAFGDKIIQLTWTSQTGFVYDKESFTLINTLQYPTQGWGITTDGKKLFMSDGTQTIYFLEPEYFTEIDRIEVYDNEGAVRNLNELEYIDGVIYANIFQKEEIIAFDPETGKVLQRIDCRKIIPEGYHGEIDNVLNGIAYDQDNKRIFITGKRWPHLYEVQFLKY
ncbi:MAG: glutaminyl-peptide cyclotransferase [Bacteroidales bacterium]|jgi:glutamine cyclotransferase|nr:glutaminyl-peptide cyclotransferase [Bacteroidales bacterium]